MPELIEYLQEEFGLDEEKAKKIKSIADSAIEELQEERRALMGDFGSMSDEERQTAIEELREVSREIRDDARNSIKKLLSEKQLERLQQLKLQFTGARALEDGLIQDMFAFTEDQLTRVKEAIAAANEKRQAWAAESWLLRSASGLGRRGNGVQLSDRFPRHGDTGVVGPVSASGPLPTSSAGPCRKRRGPSWRKGISFCWRACRAAIRFLHVSGILSCTTISSPFWLPSWSLPGPSFGPIGIRWR